VSSPSSPFRVCLFGFAPVDEQSLGRMLVTKAERTPHYVMAATLEQCDLVVANADNADALAELVRLELLDQAVYIGSDIEGEGWLKHPVDGQRLLREVDRLALRQAPWYAPRTEPSELPAGTTPVPGVGNATAPQVRGRRSGKAGPRLPPVDKLARTRALLVDDSEIALRFLETRLHRMGVQTERATTSGRALELLTQQPFDFVLLDVELGSGSDLDGLALCQHIKRHRHPVAGASPPSVIMVSAHHAEIDRARGSLAGCDAYIAKPVDETLLLQTLAQHAPP
jgi:two-component system, cell cycle response regulator